MKFYYSVIFPKHKKEITMLDSTILQIIKTAFLYVTLHGKTGKKVMTWARLFDALNKRKFS